MPETIVYTRLCDALGIPFGDADIALAYTPYQTWANRRLYNTAEALDALEVFYKNRAAENRARYERHRAGVFRERAARAEAHIERIRKWRADNE